MVTFTFFRVASPWPAFKRMGQGPALLSTVPSLTFGKFLGTGAGNGFSVFPDFKTYALLAVWPDIASARQMLFESAYFLPWFSDAVASGTLFLDTCRVHGAWDGKQPFDVTVPQEADRPVAILTRATIKPTHLLSFWRDVPSVSRSLRAYPDGLLSAKGVGEWPLVQQATFSVWRKPAFADAYAYGGERHRRMVQKTRRTGWYAEELFARFHPVARTGNWPAWESLEHVPEL